MNDKHDCIPDNILEREGFMNSPIECPNCGNKECHLLSTSRDDRNYCHYCDIRFTDEGKILND